MKKGSALQHHVHHGGAHSCFAVDGDGPLGPNSTNTVSHINNHLVYSREVHATGRSRDVPFKRCSY